MFDEFFVGTRRDDTTCESQQLILEAECVCAVCAADSFTIGEDGDRGLDAGTAC